MTRWIAIGSLAGLLACGTDDETPGSGSSSSTGALATTGTTATGGSTSTSTTGPMTTTQASESDFTAGTTSSTSDGGSSSGSIADGSDSSGTSTGGMMLDYPPCPTGEDAECPPGYNCVPIINDAGGFTGTYCGSMACKTGDDCPPGPQGTAVTECVQLSTPVCTLICSGGLVCPMGMFCNATDIGESVCIWLTGYDPFAGP